MYKHIYNNDCLLGVEFGHTESGAAIIFALGVYDDEGVRLTNTATGIDLALQVMGVRLPIFQLEFGLNRIVLMICACSFSLYWSH